MLDRDQTMDILVLRKQGRSIRRIARETGHSRNTVRRVMRDGGPRPFRAAKRASKLDAFKDYLRERFGGGGLSAVRLAEEIRQMGFVGSTRIVCRFLAGLRQRVPARLTTRFETPPGHQAQVDWAEVGRCVSPEGASARVFVFVMVLSFCRALYIQFTHSMRMETLIGCHQAAFAYFGGWPATILYDNMRQVVVRPGLVNARFRDFADHHGFEPRAHRPYRPRTKGKVERMVGYIRDSFLAGRSFDSLDDLNGRGRAWLDTVANVRVHATTGRRPFDLLQTERPHLTPAGAIAPYRIVRTARRSVDAEAMVRFDNARYSVPAPHAGARVEVEAAGGTIRIRAGQVILAEHPRSFRRGARVEDPAHVLQRHILSVAPPGPPAPRGPVLAFAGSTHVESRPLSFYQRILNP